MPKFQKMGEGILRMPTTMKIPTEFQDPKLHIASQVADMGIIILSNPINPKLRMEKI